MPDGNQFFCGGCDPNWNGAMFATDQFAGVVCRAPTKIFVRGCLLAAAAIMLVITGIADAAVGRAGTVPLAVAPAAMIWTRHRLTSGGFVR